MTFIVYWERKNGSVIFFVRKKTLSEKMAVPEPNYCFLISLPTLAYKQIHFRPCPVSCGLQSAVKSVSRLVISDSLQPHRLWPARLLCPWDSPGKSTGVGSHSHLQWIFPTQGWNPGLPNYRLILYWLSHQPANSAGSPREDWLLGHQDAFRF